MSGQNNNLIYSIAIFLAFLISLIVISLFKKIYYFFRYKKRFYIIPRTSIKGIANISMIIAISIAIIILLTIATADIFNVIFRTWPGTRVTIESVLIKIGGLLFGPFLGVFIGAMTDLLTVALTAGVFHYGYLVAAMAYGLISGFVSEIFISSKKRIWWKAILSSGVLMFCILIVSLFFMLPSNNFTQIFEFSIFSFNISIDPKILISIIDGFIFLGVLIIWVIFIIDIEKRKKINKFETEEKETKLIKLYDWHSSIMIVLVISIVTDSLINLLIMPSFDAELSTIKYSEWVLLRSIIFIPEVIFNCLIMVPIYKIVHPIINYNYKDDLLEDIKYPVFIE